MTNKEAIEVVKGNFGCLATDMSICRQCDAINENECAECVDKAFDMAIVALDKQISKAPYHIHNIPFAWFCSNCNEQCGWIEIGNINRPNYCAHCGQKLDWGDE